MMRAVGRSTSEETNAKDWSRVEGGSKTLRLVTIRTKPDSTRTERANGSEPVASRVIQSAYSEWSGGGILDMRVYQDVDIGKQHLESLSPMPEPCLVILRVERPRTIEIYSGACMDATHGNQPEWRRLQCFATLQSVVQCYGDKGADADASGLGRTSHLLGQLVVKGYCCSHDALA